MSNTLFQRLAALVTPALLATALFAPPAPALAWGKNSVVGSGKAASETRNVGDFQGVSVLGSMDVVVRQGPQAPVKVEADDNLLAIIETVVENGRDGPVLEVRTKRGTSYSSRSKILVTVTIPKLSVVAISGSGDARIESFTTGPLRLAVSGSGGIVMDKVTSDELTAAISGSGDIDGSGKTGKLGISIAGSGDVKLADLRADDVKIRIAGSGDAEVQAARTLDVSIAGSGDVLYSGEATVKSSVAGSGSIRKR